MKKRRFGLLHEAMIIMLRSKVENLSDQSLRLRASPVLFIYIYIFIIHNYQHYILTLLYISDQSIHTGDDDG